MKKDFLYACTCLCFCIMIGGAIYEHLNVVPQWSAAPPLSLRMFQGEYALKPERFWQLIHPVNLLLFVATISLHWHAERRKPLMQVAVAYVVILAVTAIYFVPELIRITTTAFAQTADLTLTRRAKTWELWSLVRLGVLLVLAVRHTVRMAASQSATQVASPG